MRKLHIIRKFLYMNEFSAPVIIIIAAIIRHLTKCNCTRVKASMGGQLREVAISSINDT